MCANTNPRGLFLDFDGTLVDSLGLMRKIYSDFLAKFSKQGSDKEFEHLNGPSLPEIISYLKAKYELSAAQEILLNQYNQLIDEEYESAVPMPGAMELIKSAHQIGITVVIVTSNSGGRVERWLQRHLSGEIPMIVGAETKSRGKPWPDLYLQALALSKCEAGISWAVEDSAQGQQAAKAAGLNVLAYKPGNAGVSTELQHEIRDLREALHFFKEYV